MSKENIKLFYEALAKDKALQEKVNVISQKYVEQKTGDIQAEEIYNKELVPLAKEAGYDFSLAEFKEYAEETKKPGMREVSEEELAGVAGGNCVCFLGGGGTLFGNTCACVIGGGGSGGGRTCVCVAAGAGTEEDIPNG